MATLDDDGSTSEMIGVSGHRDLAELIAQTGQISRALTGLAAGTIPRALTGRLTQVPGISAAGVWLVTPGGKTARLDAWDGRRALQAADMAPVELGASELGRMIDNPAQRDGETLARQLLPPGWLQPRERVSFAGFPLRRDDRTRGVLGIFCQRRLDDAEMELLALLARQAAAEIERDRPGDTPTAVAPPIEFVARIVHELRTPLTVVRGNIQLAAMALAKGKPERVPARLETTLQQVDDMVSLIQNLQDISQIERGRLDLTLHTADLTATLWRAVQRIERQIASDHHAIRMLAPQPIIVEHDTTQIEQALVNLLSNAVIYSPQGGTIEVRAEQAADSAVVSITDLGVGIPLAEQQRIFEPFYRAETGVAVKAKGLGLGLAISQATIERHGGRIDVQSQPGQGSTFTVRVPRTPPRA